MAPQKKKTENSNDFYKWSNKLHLSSSNKKIQPNNFFSPFISLKKRQHYNVHNRYKNMKLIGSSRLEDFYLNFICIFLLYTRTTLKKLIKGEKELLWTEYFHWEDFPPNYFFFLWRQIPIIFVTQLLILTKIFRQSSNNVQQWCMNIFGFVF